MKQQLISDLGNLAIQIKQEKEALEEKEKRYKTLNDQVVLLQTLTNEGYEISKLISENDAGEIDKEKVLTSKEKTKP